MNITWRLTHKRRPCDAYLLRRVTTISQNNVFPYPELRYSACFFPVRRKTNYRIPPCGPTLQQKRNRKATRQRAFDYKLKKAREERINLNLEFKHKPVQRPYNHDI